MNIGDLVTGVDRRYERSIYRVMEINDDKIMALPISLAGYVFKDRKQLCPIGTVDQFRLATEEEMKISSTGPMQWDIRDKWLEETYGIVYRNTLPITLCSG